MIFKLQFLKLIGPNFFMSMALGYHELGYGRDSHEISEGGGEGAWVVVPWRL
jgi:hypothetical protein